ncbi:MAG TPA: hypothetical protein VF075_07685, partial [Pyrinomonadaceae bacterium]
MNQVQDKARNHATLNNPPVHGTMMLRIDIQEFRNGKIFCLEGRIGIVETEILSVAVRSHSDGKTVVLDFSQVIGIDAA